MEKIGKKINLKKLKDIKLNMFDKIYDVYWKLVGYKIRNCYQSIANIIRWIPTIYKDKDWDDYYIFEILKVKIQHVAKYTERRKFYEGWERDVEYMKTCIRLIDKIKEGDYEIEYLDGTISKIFDEGDTKLTQEEIELNNKKYQEFLSKNKSTHRQVLKYLELHSDRYCVDKEDLALQALLTSSFKHNKCRRMLFKLLEYRIEYWWD